MQINPALILLEYLRRESWILPWPACQRSKVAAWVWQQQVWQESSIEEGFFFYRFFFFSWPLPLLTHTHTHNFRFFPTKVNGPSPGTAVLRGRPSTQFPGYLSGRFSQNIHTHTHLFHTETVLTVLTDTIVFHTPAWTNWDTHTRTHTQPFVAVVQQLSEGV